jgi:hypothetical protein
MNRSSLCDNLRHGFAVMMLVQFLIVLFVYLETKGLSLEEVQKSWGLAGVQEKLHFRRDASPWHGSP